MSLAELFPAEAAMGVADVTGQNREVAAGLAAGLGADSGTDPGRRMPLIAGIVVTLAILLSGGGFLWWRNRDTRYWPA